MVGGGIDASLPQILGHLFCRLPAQTVDDTRLQWPGLDEIQDKLHLLCGFIASFDRQTQIRPIKAGNEFFCVFQL